MASNRFPRSATDRRSFIKTSAATAGGVFAIGGLNLAQADDESGGDCIFSQKPTFTITAQSTGGNLDWVKVVLSAAETQNNHGSKDTDGNVYIRFEVKEADGTSHKKSYQWVTNHQTAAGGGTGTLNATQKTWTPAASIPTAGGGVKIVIEYVATPVRCTEKPEKKKLFTQ